MNTLLDLTILWPALIAGLLVLATHIPLGIKVLERGIVFIDLAIAQIAGIGVIAAHMMGFENQKIIVQIAAVSAAVLGSLLLTFTEKRWPEIQEALIGTLFILAATGGIILLSHNVHGGEQLRDLLVGQVLWVTVEQLIPSAIATAIILFVWFKFKNYSNHTLFYLLFAIAVTVSVQLVGVYLVFASLIIPALATRYYKKRRLLAGYALGFAAYLLGLILSVWFDLPAGAVMVWALAISGLIVHALKTKPSEINQLKR